MVVELSTNEQFRNARRIVGPDALAHGDFYSKLRLSGLKPGETYHNRITFQDFCMIVQVQCAGDWKVSNTFRSPRDIKFAWSG